jgi:peptidoglycan L-alanyl-D-glutamate endopeptidase CwlK
MTLAPRSLKCLEGVHSDLVKVVKRADELGARFHITCGLRTEEQQRAMVKAGKSKTMKSRHLTGHAVDFVVAEPGGGISYDHADMAECAKVFKQAAAEFGVKIEWGGDWKSFVDTPHIELDRKVYPPNGGDTKIAAPISVPSQTVKPLVKSRILWNTTAGVSMLTWLNEWVQHAFGVATAAASQFASMGPSRDLLATLGGNGKAIAIAVGVGCVVSALAAKVDDHNKQQATHDSAG